MNRYDRGATGTGRTSASILEIEVVIEYDYKITYEGCAAKLSGPPEDCYPAEDPEYEIEDIRIFEDIASNNTKTGKIEYLDVPKWLKDWAIDYLNESGCVFEQMSEDFS